MKKKILSFTFVICICLNLLAVSPLSVFAEESGTCGDNLTWTLSGNTLTISGTDDMYDYNSDNEVPWYQIKDDIYYLVIDNGVTSIGNYAFYQVTHITDVTIPASVKSIGNYAFYECSKLKNIIGADGVVSIGESAFSYCSALESISIPAGVTSIADSAFIWCGNLNISVDEKNEYFSSFNGVLFNKDKTELVAYANDKIESEFTIPYGVKSIGYLAFIECVYMTSITIPDSVTFIDKYAFFSCYVLSDVYYTGTQEQWEQISIGKNNTYLQNATIHYNCSPEQSRPVCQINGAVASADKMTVYVSSSLGTVNNTMLIAKYKSGILIGLTKKQIDLLADSNEVVFENFAKGNVDTIKIMLWSRAEPFKPLCGEYTIL